MSTVQPLFPNSTYASAADYTAKKQQLCPQCDSRFPLKTWEDPSALPGASGTYTIVVAGQTMPLAITATIQNAGRVNFPTAPPVYPPYSVPTTNATENGQPANPENLSTEADAQGLVASVVASGVALNVGYRLATGAEQGNIVDGTDGRKIWILTGNDSAGNQITDFVGVDIARMYEYGVGAPGTWSVNAISVNGVATGIAELVWIETPHQTSGLISPAAGSAPIPIVPLPPGATLAATTMSAFDPMEAQIVLAAPPSTGPSAETLLLMELIAILKANGISAPTIPTS